jgi:hypothetical protein
MKSARLSQPWALKLPPAEALEEYNMPATQSPAKRLKIQLPSRKRICRLKNSLAIILKILGNVLAERV